MKQYSVDLRERLLQVVDAGLSQAEATRLLGVSTATLQRWRQQQRQTGSVAPRPRSGRPRSIDRGQEAALLAQVRAAPDATLREHCAQWAVDHGVRLSEATISRALARLGWPLKKSRSGRANKTRPPARRGAKSLPPATQPTSCSLMKVAPIRR